MPLRRLLIILFAILSVVPTLADNKTEPPRKKKVAAPTIIYPDKLPVKALISKTIVIPHEAKIKAGHAWAGLVNEGIDVSHYQGDIDWDAVAATKEISYVYIKASEGESLTDDYYRQNIEGAHRVGLKVGSYHYYRPDADQEAQYNNLVSQIRGSEQDLAVIVDVEKRGSKSEEDFIADLKAFLLKVEKKYNSKPIIYTFHNFYNRYLSGQFKDYRLMIARYRSDAPQLDDGKDFEAWQYTQRGKIDGIRGYVDRSLVTGNYSLSDLAFEE